MSTFGERNEDRLLRALQTLLGLEVTDLERALNAAAQQMAEVMQAHKVDLFLHDRASGCLIAVGMNKSPMARKQKALGLDHLPVSDGGTSAHVFRTGESRLSRHPIMTRSSYAASSRISASGRRSASHWWCVERGGAR